MVVPGNQLPKLPHHNQLKVLLSCNGTVHPHWYNLVSTECKLINVCMQISWGINFVDGLIFKDHLLLRLVLNVNSDCLKISMA